MPSTATLPYGSWPSPISAELLAAAGVRLGEPALTADACWWLESRPTEGGRAVLVRRTDDGAVTDAVPPDLNVRTLAHEYGGGAYALWGGSVFVADFDSQRWYRLDDDADPVALTPQPAVSRGERYADACPTPDGATLYAVRERHQPPGGQGRPGPVVNELVAVAAAGGAPPRTVAGGHDFFSSPKVRHDGRQLAWLSWDHPRMPWDGTDLWVADLGVDGMPAAARHVAGGPAESVFQPSWSPDGLLHFVSDRTGWWNLYRVEAGGEVTALAPMEAEFGAPQWLFGMATYAFLDDGRIVARVTTRGVDRLGVLEPGRPVRFLDLPYTAFGASLRARGRRLLTTAAGPAEPNAVLLIDDVDDPRPQVLRSSTDMRLDPGLVSVPQPLEFPTAGGQTAHAHFYPPANAAVRAPGDERPPLLVISHGGPTSQAPAAFSLSVLFWTSRGFAVADVNYGGSTGYGRAYRERLNGRWGVVDTEDCIAAARWLADRGEVDPARMAIRGGSAGGYTTLCALTFHDVFAAGASHFGVADPAALARDTHKFESRYLDSLLGPWPEAAEVYRQRSPIHHTQGLNCPMILLQGNEDAIVPPSQAERMADALRAKGVPFAYLAFDGEQHGFRRAENIRRAHEAELSFYGQVFGFTPADDIEPVALERASS